MIKQTNWLENGFIGVNDNWDRPTVAQTYAFSVVV